MLEPRKSPSPAETGRRFLDSCRAWTDRALLLLAVAALAFFAWNLFRNGWAVRDDQDFRAWAEVLFLLLCVALGFSLVLEVGSAWREGLRRMELPPRTGAPHARQRSFRAAGPVRPLIGHCTAELDRHFRRFYAFHRYQAPFTAYFYYAKRGSLSLLSAPWMKTGLFLFFLIGATTVPRGASPVLRGWETVILEAGGFLVISGLFIRAAVPYRKVWVRIVELNDRACLTLSCSGRSRDPFFEAFSRSLETQSGVVSCSIHSR